MGAGLEADIYNVIPTLTNGYSHYWLLVFLRHSWDETNKLETPEGSRSKQVDMGYGFPAVRRCSNLSSSVRTVASACKPCQDVIEALKANAITCAGIFDWSSPSCWQLSVAKFKHILKINYPVEGWWNDVREYQKGPLAILHIIGCRQQGLEGPGQTEYFEDSVSRAVSTKPI